ncbi:methionine--tRNA ligase, mitochondrial-like [Chelonus insularis]|uniref:methionine--tRNA ligase, mitochondrial-like n=1 Tax=Chelonus insularis TaxID=460826 RepID=UPI00158B36C0|nr:methionine--tRNA ligase, mitochondrial-like [Chelonus insularis]
MASFCRLVRSIRISKVGLTKRSIMTTSTNAKKFLDALKDNPYFDKYAGAIAKLQQTNPEEFLSKIEENEKKKKRVNKNDTPQGKSFSTEFPAKPSLSSSLQTNTARLSDVMKMELLEDKVNKIVFKNWRTFCGVDKVRANINQNFVRNFSDYQRKSVYVTTPIFYVNSGPHIGHLYTAALADTFTRYNFMLGHEVFFITGTDEHGNKVRNAAIKNGVSEKDYCDNISNLFKDMCHEFDIDYSKFIRTTDLDHEKSVHHFWNTLEKNGHIYLGKYSGWYCTEDEAFVPETEIEEKKFENGTSIKISNSSGNTVEWMEEENYKFRLSSFRNDLKYWLKDEKSVQPLKYHKILSSWIEEGSCLQDLSVSRPSFRSPWGIKVPRNDSQTIYVWLDALVNYLTGIGYSSDHKLSKFWPPSLQVIGKDILKFHGVYWPAFLIAANLEPPRTLLCHSHWTVDDKKMSKSKGNVVSPSDAAKIFTRDGLRYFLLREAVPHSDANYNEDKIRVILNTELADTLGNLVSRCMGKAVNPQKIVPEPHIDHINILNSDEAKKLAESLHLLSSTAQHHYEDFNLHRVVDSVMQTLFLANKMIECQKPWVLAKEKLSNNQDSSRKLEAALALGLEAARIASLVLLPIIPRLSSELLNFLDVPNSARMWDNCKYLNTGRKNVCENDKQENFAFFAKLK